MLSDIEMLRFTCNEYEKQLIELMGDEEFVRFSSKVAKKLFAIEISGMKDSPFKKLVMDNFEAITGSEEQYRNLINKIHEQEGDDNDKTN